MSKLIEKLSKLPQQDIEALDRWLEVSGESAFQSWLRQARHIAQRTRSQDKSESGAEAANPIRIVATVSPNEFEMLAAGVIGRDDLIELLKANNYDNLVRSVIRASPFFHEQAPAIILMKRLRNKEDLTPGYGSAMILPDGVSLKFLAHRMEKLGSDFDPLLKSKAFCDWASAEGPASAFQYAVKSAGLARTVLGRDPSAVYFAQQYFAPSEIEQVARQHPIPGLPTALTEAPLDLRLRMVELNPCFGHLLNLEEWTPEVLAKASRLAPEMGLPGFPRVLRRFPDLFKSLAREIEHVAHMLALVGPEEFALNSEDMDLALKAGRGSLPLQYPEAGRTTTMILKDMESYPALLEPLLSKGRLPIECYNDDLLSRVKIIAFPAGVFQEPRFLNHLINTRGLEEVLSTTKVVEAIPQEVILQLKSRPCPNLSFGYGHDLACWPRWLTPSIVRHIQIESTELLANLGRNVMTYQPPSNIPDWFLQPDLRSIWLNQPSTELFKVLESRKLITPLEVEAMVLRDPKIFEMIPQRLQTIRSREIAVAFDGSFLRKVHMAHRTPRLQMIAERIAVDPPPGETTLRPSPESEFTEFSL